MSNKKAQIQLSFGMIFSIIIIIATVAVAFYFIQKFLDSSDCVVLGDFKSKLQSDIDAAWRSPVAQKKFTGSLTRGIESVCFGSIADRALGAYPDEYAEFSYLVDSDKNLFLYPSNEACNGKAAELKLNNVDSSGFFCKKVINGKIELNIIKESATDSLVKVKE
ncbi:MAG: hypothetical protein AABW82_00890 [Nanoarchaeota archaeon]